MGQTLHEAIITDPRKLAREIASDVMASEEDIAAAIKQAIDAAYERAALWHDETREALEKCAATSERAGLLHEASEYRTQAAVHIISASSIRSLKTENTNG